MTLACGLFVAMVGMARGLQIDVRREPLGALPPVPSFHPPSVHSVPGDHPALPPLGAKNVLLLLADDLRPELGCYGHGHVKTPRIDEFATGGTLFHFAYAQYAFCAPSRNSFLSGRRPHITRVWNFAEDFRSNGVGPGWTTLPGNFKRNGYATLGCGKTFHPGSPYQFDYPYSWSFDLMPYGWGGEEAPPTVANSSIASIRCDNVTVFCVDGEQGCPEEAMVDADETKKWCSIDTSRLPPNPDGTPKLLWDQAEAKLAVERLRFARSRQDAQKTRGETAQPFFLAVGFHKPHKPWIAPKEFYDLYPEVDSLPAPIHAEWPSGAPDVAWHGKGNPRTAQYTSNETMKARRGYYATVSYIDSLVGTILDELDALGLRNDTAVVFTSDHGAHLGEYNLWDKMTNFEDGVRVPLIIRAPWLQAAVGRRSDAPAELVDLYKTLAEIAGIPVPEDNTHKVVGRSLVPAMHGSARLSPEYSFSQFAKKNNENGPFDVCFRCFPSGESAPAFMGYTVRNDEWRWTEWFAYDRAAGRPNMDKVVATELYDHRGDDGRAAFGSFEHTNRCNATDPFALAARQELELVLREKFQA